MDEDKLARSVYDLHDGIVFLATALTAKDLSNAKDFETHAFNVLNRLDQFQKIIPKWNEARIPKE